MIVILFPNSPALRNTFLQFKQIDWFCRTLPAGKQTLYVIALVCQLYFMPYNIDDEYAHKQLQSTVIVPFHMNVFIIEHSIT